MWQRQPWPELASLDPQRDHQRIYHLLVGYEFPWDVLRALELALYRTFCVPSISKLLDRTGELLLRPQRRYDDTSLLMAELSQHGYDSPRGKQALERINRIHGHYQISNDDFLYVLSTFLLEPVRWTDRFGWRAMTPGECTACHAFWREVGLRMGIREIPADYPAFEAWSRAYERASFRYSDANRRVGEATRDMLLTWLPAPLRPLGRSAIYALLDEPMLEAFGFPRPSASTRSLVAGALRLRARAVARLPAPSESGFITHAPARSYPQGYAIGDLGPPGMLASLRRKGSVGDGPPPQEPQEPKP